MIRFDIAPFCSQSAAALKSRALLLPPLAFLALALCASGQILNVGDDTSTPIKGVGHDYIKMLSETVNPANGSVSIRIQTPTPQGRGISLPFSFAYDSNGAQHLASTGTGLSEWWDNSDYLSQGGWSYSMPMLSNVRVALPLPPSPKECFYWMDYMFADPTGGRHSLGVAYVNGNSQSNPCAGASSIPSQVLTGGDDYYKASLSGTGFPATIADSAGTVYTFLSASAQGNSEPNSTSSAMPTSIEDRNGNQIVITDNGSGSFTVTDPVGRTLLSSSGFGVTGNTVAVSGLQSSYSITWETISPNFTINSWLMYSYEGDCYSSLAPDEGTTINVIKSIGLPNGQSYQFSYDPSYGMLDKITYPTGGYVQYTWGINSRSQSATFEDTRGLGNACWYQHDSPAVTQRTVSFDGVHTALTQVFSYSTVWNSSTFYQWTTKTATVTTTDNVTGAVSSTQYAYTPINSPAQPNDSRRFAAQIPLEQTTTYKNSSGTPINTVTKAWYDQYELKSQQTLLNDSSSNFTNQTTYAYGPGAQVTDKQEYDYGSGSPGTLLRETVTNYQTFADTALYTAGPSIFNQPCQIIVYAGSQTSGTRQAETDFYYDSGSTSTVCGTAGTPSVTLVSSLTEHDETNYSASSKYPRGNVTTMVKQCFQGTTACTSGNPTTTYSYDEAGQRLSMTDPKLNVTNYSFTDSYLSTNTGTYTTTAGSPPSGKVTDAYLTKLTYPATGTSSHVESFTYGYNDGELTNSTDENSQVTIYRYNDNFDRPTESDLPDGGQTMHVYNDSPTSPSVTTCQLINGTAGATCTATSPPTGWKTTEAVLDGLGHVVHTQLASDPDGITNTVSTYDGFNRPYTVTNPYRSTLEQTYGITTRLYDAIGRSCLVVPPDFASSAPTSCPTTAPLGSTFTSYSGNLTTVADEVGNQRTSQTDGLGRLTEVWEAPTVTGYNYPTIYQYDALNDLTNVTQNGNNSANARIRSFVYDSLARLTSANNPESGTITYSYDLDSNVSSKVAPEPGQTGTAKVTTNYTYDALNRLTQKAYVGMSTATVKFAYDGATVLTSCGQNPPSITSPTNLIGRRSQMCGAESGSAWSYDSMGRPLLDSRINAGGGNQTKYSVGYMYNLDGSLKTLTYPSGDVVTYTVGGAGRVTQLSDASNNYVEPYSAGSSGVVPLAVSRSVTEVEYWGFGGLGGIYLGLTATSGIFRQENYTSRLQPNAVVATVNNTGNSVFSRTYNFNFGNSDNGNVIGIVDSVNSIQSTAFTYDPLNRISQANTTAMSGTGCWGVTYTIDPWGNLINQAGVSGMGTCYTGLLSATATTKNQLSGIGMTYDAAGNVTNDGLGNTPTYDAENRIATDAGVTYYYDADGVRMEKSSGTKYWFGSGGEVLAEASLTGTIDEEYVYFNGERIARVDRPSGTVHYYFGDHLGSASVITDASGNVEQQYYYYPYGSLVGSNGSDTNHYMFTGKERDSESGLDYFGFRHYESSRGRFMKPDEPFADQDEANPQSWNLYSYVRNNPLRYTDLTGNACVSDGNGGWTDDNSGGETCAQVNAADQNIQSSATVTVTAPDVPNMALAAGAATLELGWEGGPPDWAVGLGLLGLGCVQTHCWTPITNLFSQTGNNSPPPASSPSTSQTATPNPDDGGGRKWKFGSNKSEQQWRSNLERRGWTPDQIDEAIANGQKFPAQNNINPSNGATRFVNPTTGRSVVLDNVTNEVIHVGGDGFKY